MPPGVGKAAAAVIVANKYASPAAATANAKVAKALGDDAPPFDEGQLLLAQANPCRRLGRGTLTSNYALLVHDLAAERKQTVARLLRPHGRQRAYRATREKAPFGPQYGQPVRTGPAVSRRAAVTYVLVNTI